MRDYVKMRNRAFLTTIVFSAVGVMQGCAGTYSLKEGEPTAYVRFSTNVEPAIFRHIPEPGCDDVGGENIASFHTLKGKQLSDIRMLGSTGQPSDTSLERAVVAGRTFGILASSQQFAQPYSPGYSCSVGIKTTFEAGRHYEVSFELRDSSCRTTVSELIQTATGISKKTDTNARYFRARYSKDFCNR